MLASLYNVYTLWIGLALLGLAFVVLVIRLITWKRSKDKVAPKREEVQLEISIEIVFSYINQILLITIIAILIL